LHAIPALQGGLAGGPMKKHRLSELRTTIPPLLSPSILLLTSD
jgi:hypothetical protein